MNTVMLYILSFTARLREKIFTISNNALRLGNFLSSRLMIHLFLRYAKIASTVIYDNKAALASKNIKIITGMDVNAKDIAFYHRFSNSVISLLATDNICLRKDIEQCARILSSSINSERPVVFMPFHVFSDTIAVITATLADNRDNYIIAITDEQRDKLKNVAGFRNYLESRMRTVHVDKEDAIVPVIRNVRNKKSCLTIFPDILPEYTSGHIERKQTIKEIILFDNKGIRHAGPDSIAAISGADVIPFYIYWHLGRLNISVLPKLNAQNSQLLLDDMIEKVLRDKTAQWMLWHHTSFFYFNP